MAAGNVSQAPFGRQVFPSELGGPPAVGPPPRLGDLLHPLSFSSLFSAPQRGVWVGLVISPATFHHGNGGGLRPDPF